MKGGGSRRVLGNRLVRSIGSNEDGKIHRLVFRREVESTDEALGVQVVRQALPAGWKPEAYKGLAAMLEKQSETYAVGDLLHGALDTLPGSTPKIVMALPVVPSTGQVHSYTVRVGSASPTSLVPGNWGTLELDVARLLQLATHKLMHPHLCVGLFFPNLYRYRLSPYASRNDEVHRESRDPMTELLSDIPSNFPNDPVYDSLPLTLPPQAYEELSERYVRASEHRTLQSRGVLALVTGIHLPVCDNVTGALRATSGEISFVVLPQRIRMAPPVDDEMARGLQESGREGFVHVVPVRESHKSAPMTPELRTQLLFQAKALQQIPSRAERPGDRMGSLQMYPELYLPSHSPAQAVDMAVHTLVSSTVDPSNAFQFQMDAVCEPNVVKRVRVATEFARLERMMQYLLERQDEELSGHLEGVGQADVAMLRNYLVSKSKPSLAQEYLSRLEGKKVPEEAMKVISEELAKLQKISPQSSEYSVSRNYLDVLTKLPWGVRSSEVLDPELARQVLDREHFGLTDVKDRVVELAAVGKLRSGLKGKILLLVGPPGVGKTSIGKSIAHALGRKFHRFSVGGLHDDSEIKGNRRTYLGAMPGKPLQALSVVGVSNPVLLIDEVDKMVRSSVRGDPTAALLEVLDPKQNADFVDYYVGTPFDMSEVLFVCTANSTDAISKPLLDRMEVIRIPGYTELEKQNIARNYLWPQLLEASGLVHAGKPLLNLSDDAIPALVANYCREAGVRDLKKSLEKMIGKIAHRFVMSENSAAAASSLGDDVKIKKKGRPAKASGKAAGPITASSFEIPLKLAMKNPKTISAKDLDELLGKPLFRSEEIYTAPLPVGVVPGLAYSDYGGAISFVEVIRDEPWMASSKRGSLTVTGRLGDVMKESVTLAHSFTKNYLAARKGLRRSAVHTGHLYLHVPFGSVPKDGTSSGLAVATALLSLAIRRPVREGYAMTGELSLNGHVLPIAGLREKLLAAKRAGYAHVILPLDNERDWLECPEEIREGLTPHFVRTFEQVDKILFPNSDSEEPMDSTPQLNPPN